MEPISVSDEKFYLCDTSLLFMNMVGGTAEQLRHQSGVLMLMKIQLKRKMDLLGTAMLTCKAAPWGYKRADMLQCQTEWRGTQFSSLSQHFTKKGFYFRQPFSRCMFATTLCHFYFPPAFEQELIVVDQCTGELVWHGDSLSKIRNNERIHSGPHL